MPLDCSFRHRNVITFPHNIWDRPEVMVHPKSTPWYTAKCVHLHQMFCYNPSVAVQYIFSRCFIVTCQFMSNYTAITQFIAPGRNNYHHLLKLCHSAAEFNLTNGQYTNVLVWICFHLYSKNSKGIVEWTLNVI